MDNLFGKTFTVSQQYGVGVHAEITEYAWCPDHHKTWEGFVPVNETFAQFVTL